MPKLLYNKNTMTGKLFSIYFVVLSGQKNVVVLCDNWYAKKNFLYLASESANPDITCNAKVNTALHGLPPAQTGSGRHLFLNTAMPTDLSFFCAWHAHAQLCWKIENQLL